jgi:allantoicase
MVKHFFITATMKNGDKWETTRHTEEGLNAVIETILADGGVEKFSVEVRNI